jgi:hypothetical protein
MGESTVSAILGVLQGLVFSDSRKFLGNGSAPVSLILRVLKHSFLFGKLSALGLFRNSDQP